MREQAGDPTRGHPIEAAFKRLGFSHTTGFRLIKTGQLKTYKVGRFRYVSDVELVRFIQEREAEAVNEDRASAVAPAVAAMARKRAEASA